MIYSRGVLTPVNTLTRSMYILKRKNFFLLLKMILELKYLFSRDRPARPYCQTDSKTEIDVVVGAILPAYLKVMLHETIVKDDS